MEVQVSEEEAKDVSGVVDCLSAQEEVKLVAWRKAFNRIPHKPPLQIVQGELKTGITCLEATFMSCTLPCSQAFRASLAAYDRALEDVKDTYFKPYILAACNYARYLAYYCTHLAFVKHTFTIYFTCVRLQCDVSCLGGPERG